MIALGRRKVESGHLIANQVAQLVGLRLRVSDGCCLMVFGIVRTRVGEELIAADHRLALLARLLFTIELLSQPSTVAGLNQDPLGLNLTDGVGNLLVTRH